MTRYPGATYRPIPEAYTQPKITARAVIVHSQAGRGSLYGWWLNPASKGLECHFWVSEAGRVEQYVPTDVRADANGEANAFAISIETESSPQATERWNPVQAAALTKLIDWCCTTHGIPRRQMATAYDSGLGWHVMFGAPGPWTSVRGKTCPGPARIPQFRDEIIPAVAALAAPPPDPTPEPEDDDMKPAYTLKAKGPAVGKVRDGQVWVVSADGVEAWRPKSANKKGDKGDKAWRARLDILYTPLGGGVVNYEADPVPCSVIAAKRLDLSE